MAFDSRATPFPVTSNTTPQDISVTVSVGTNRTAIFAVVREATGISVTSATFDPAGINAAMTSILSLTHPTISGLRIDVFRYNIADGVPDGSYVCRAAFSSSSIANLVTLYARTINDAAAGELYAGSDDGTGSDANVTLSATSASGAHVMAWALNASASATWTWSGGVTEDGEQNETNYTTSDASGIASGSSTTVTAADGATSNKLMAVVVIGEDTGGGSPSNAPRALINGALRSPLINGGLIR